MSTMPIVAQDTTYQFSLQEAINFALENNRASKIAALDIEAAEEQKWETIATGLPQVSADIGYQNWIKQQVSLVPAEFFGGASGEFAEVQFGTKHTLNAFATLNQLIFDGSYIVGLQSTKVFLEISENAKIKTDLEVRKAVINAYGNVLVAEESIDILERNKSVLEKNLSETTKIYENGLAEEESVEQLKITLAGIESSFNNAVRLKDIAYQLFNITIGIDLNSNTILTDNLERLVLNNITLNLLEAPEDVENNIDFQIAENNLTSQELLVKLAKSRALPRINGFLNAGYSGFNDNFGYLDDDQRWFGSSLLGINMTIPIFSSLGRTAATQRAKIDLEIATEDLTETEQRLRLEIANSKSAYKFAIEDYELKKQNLDLAERIESKNETKFFEGISSSFDLRQAQTQLYTAQQELLQAMVDVINKKAELETVLNRI